MNDIDNNSIVYICKYDINNCVLCVVHRVLFCINFSLNVPTYVLLVYKVWSHNDHISMVVHNKVLSTTIVNQVNVTYTLDKLMILNIYSECLKVIKCKLTHGIN